MGDRHGGRFARRGRTLSPLRPHIDAHRGADFRWRATVFRCRGAVDRICPAQERSPRRKPPDTAHGRKDLPRARTLPSAKASRHGARAKGFAPREFALAPRADERRAALDRRTAGKTPLRRGRTREGAAAAEFIHRKKIRLLHEIQFFYGESHVGSRPIFPSFPSVGRCVARERNPVPPVAPHRGSEHRGLRRTGEMVRRFDAMCPRGGEWLPRGGNGWPCGGRCYPGIRCFGERFHRRRCANPDACGGRRCSRAHDDLGQRAFRCARPTFRNPLCDSEKTCRGRRCSRAQDNLGQRAFRCSRPGIRNPLCDNEKTFGGRRCSRGQDDLGQRAFRCARPAFRNRRRSGE